MMMRSFLLECAHGVRGVSRFRAVSVSDGDTAAACVRVAAPSTMRARSDTTARPARHRYARRGCAARHGAELVLLLYLVS